MVRNGEGLVQKFQRDAIVKTKLPIFIVAEASQHHRVPVDPRWGTRNVNGSVTTRPFVGVLPATGAVKIIGVAQTEAVADLVGHDVFDRIGVVAFHAVVDLYQGVGPATRRKAGYSSCVDEEGVAVHRDVGDAAVGGKGLVEVAIDVEGIVVVDGPLQCRPHFGSQGVGATIVAHDVDSLGANQVERSVLTVTAFVQGD